ncbi:somatostatin receptor type 2-like [Asterias amurensis]|uniref:somatostatin receptor type 2-like n=1 Tax=Asterias amurensis TaxID=7602 RepID=UPI003AB25836
MDDTSLNCTGDDVWDYSNFSSPPSDLFYSYTDAVIISIVNPCILAFGLFGNFAFLFVMASVPRMWTVTNMYLINMAVADIMFLTVAVSVKLAHYNASPVSADKSTLGHTGSVVTFVLLDLSYFASVFLVTLVSFEKFYAVCRPVQHRLMSGKKRTAKFVVGAWLLALAFSLILLPAWVVYMDICIVWPEQEEYQTLPGVIGVIDSINDWYASFHNLVQTIPFLLALIINLVIYIKIILRLGNRVGTVGVEPNARNARRQKVRNQVAFMLVVNGVVFFVCLAPFQVTSFALTMSDLIGSYNLTSEQINTVLWVGRIFTYVNSVLNPLIYSATNPRYRQAYIEAFTCSRYRQGKTDSSNDVTLTATFQQ